MKIDRPIAIAIIFFVILLLAFFFVVPEYKIFGRLQAELAQKKAEYDAEFAYYSAIAKTHSDLVAHADDLEKIDDALPTDPSLGSAVYFLQQTTKESGMLLKNVSLSKSSSGNSAARPSSDSLIQEKSKVVQDIVFSLDLLGDYASLGRLSMALESSSRIFEVTDISFGSSSQPIFGADQSQFQMTQVYSFKLQVKTHTY